MQTLKNLDRGSLSKEISSDKSIGSFVKAERSNIVFELVTAKGLISDSHGAFLHVNEAAI